MGVERFMSRAGNHGPCVAIHPEMSMTAALPPQIELRTVDGTKTRTLDALYGAFAEAWDFPEWFGRNSHAFDDFMRDLDNMVHTADGKPPAPGYFTHITDAHLILADQPDAFSWFAKCVPFYRDYYRDEASPPAAFGLLLSTPAVNVNAVRDRWLGADVPVATITV